MPDIVYDSLIIGGGPSGLFCGFLLSKLGRNFAIIDRGKHFLDREPQTPEDTCTGIGGCGLFSDGKFSYFPSASKLWHLSDLSALENSYSLFTSFITAYGIDPPQWGSFSNKIGKLFNTQTEREYKSDYCAAS